MTMVIFLTLVVLLVTTLVSFSLSTKRSTAKVLARLGVVLDVSALSVIAYMNMVPPGEVSPHEDYIGAVGAFSFVIGGLVIIPMLLTYLQYCDDDYFDSKRSS